MQRGVHLFFRLGQIVFWSLLLILFGYTYYGFFKPDPFIIERYTPFSTGLLWSLRLGIPLLIAYLIGLFWGYRTGRMSRANTATLLGSFLLCGIIGISIVHYKYNQSANPLSDFHPYLQLSPPDVRLDPDKVNIICLGGSTTEFRDSRGRSWPERTESLLRIRLGKNNIRLHNFGRQWYTTEHSLIFYETALRNRKPDAVIVMHTINDLLHNADFCYFSHGAFREDYGHFDGPLTRLVHRQNFYRFVSSMIRSMWYYHPREIVSTDRFPGLKSFERNLNTLADLAALDQVPLILMTQPNLYKASLSEKEKNALYMLKSEAIGPDKQWSESTALAGFEQYSRSVRSLAATRHLMLIDLESEIPKSLDYFTDDVHYTDLAFDRVAEIVTDQLIRQYFRKAVED